jgi:hypothetical protein
MPDVIQEDLSNVPASVIKQQAEAEAKIKELQDGPSTPPGNTDEPIVAEPIVADLEPTVVPPVIPAPVQPAISDGTADESGWEHKYSVLQGKYNSEIGPLKQSVVDLQASLDRQQIVIEGLNSQQSVAPRESKVDVDDLNPEDFKGWGDEMQTMVKTVNQLKAVIRDQAEVIKGVPAKLAGAPQDDRLNTRVESLETEVHDTRIQTYLKILDDSIPGDWRSLNKDPKFNAWLNEIDPLSLNPRRSLLTQAADALNSQQVSSIFNLYLKDSNVDAGVVIADALPTVTGNGVPPLDPPATNLSAADVKKAQNDFVQGRITESEFDKVYAKFQATLKR